MTKHLCPVTRKKRFPTKLHAEIRLVFVQKRIEVPLYTYRCEHCEGWHFTKQVDFLKLIDLHL